MVLEKVKSERMESGMSTGLQAAVARRQMSNRGRCSREVGKRGSRASEVVPATWDNSATTLPRLHFGMYNLVTGNCWSGLLGKPQYAHLT